ncbi:glycosyltransferase [Ensifer sesbaniae]|nr:glycosyltransferase [Ensifer sesbaniae]
MSHRLTEWSSQRLFAKNLAQWRKKSLGLPQCSAPPRKPARTLYAYSRFLVPSPPDWGQDVHVTGTWWLDDPDWKPSAELEAFLAGGPAPIFVGFGSMPNLDGEKLAAIFVEATSRIGKRAILATGGALGNVAGSDRIFPIEYAPHDQLFPRADAVIHHGGAGTTAAALRAGKPSIICPFFGDQPFWAHRVCALEAGPPPLDMKHLTVEKIIAALRAVDDPRIRSGASKVGLEMRGEGGVQRAIRILEDLDTTHRSGS